MTRLDIECIVDDITRIEGFDPGPLFDVSREEVLAAYNGCGPDKWPENLRDRLDGVTAEFAPAILIHDLDFWLSDGTYEKMHEANARFHRNNKCIFKQRYPLFCLRILRPSYRLQRIKAKSIMTALNLATSDAFTKQAWDDCHAALLERHAK